MVKFSILLIVFLACAGERAKPEWDKTEFSEKLEGNTFIGINIISSKDVKDTKKVVRVFSFAHAVSVDQVKDMETFQKTYLDLTEKVKHLVARDRANLFVFEEHAGIPLLFFGERGKEARKSSKAEEAFIKVALQTFQAQGYYKGKFPEVSTLEARVLFLALTDTLWRVFSETFASIAKRYEVWVVACQNVSDVQKVEANDMTPNLVDPLFIETEYHWEAVNPEVWNTCFVFSPDGKVVHKTKKVFLVPFEKLALQFSSGKLEEVKPYRIPGTQIDICIAISLDAFVPEYIKHLDRQGCDILLQPDANTGWAETGGLGRWEPEEWLSSTFGSLQPEYFIGCTNPQHMLYQNPPTCQFTKIPTGLQNIKYNVNPMMTGTLFEIVFDGQSAITTNLKVIRTLPEKYNYICIPPLNSPDFRQRFPTGWFVLLAPWAGVLDLPDFGRTLTDGDLARCRSKMRERDRKLRENKKYINSILVADLVLP